MVRSAVLVLGLSLSWALGTLAAEEKKEEEKPARKPRVSGAVDVTREIEGDQDSKILAITVTTMKTPRRESEIFHVKLDQKGLTLAREAGKRVLVFGPIKDEEKDGKAVKTITVEEYQVLYPKPRGGR